MTKKGKFSHDAILSPVRNAQKYLEFNAMDKSVPETLTQYLQKESIEDLGAVRHEPRAAAMVRGQASAKDVGNKYTDPYSYIKGG